MPREDALIPYQATELTGARILVLAAHPDDESFGAGGVLAWNAERAEAIRVWIATDGTAQEGVTPESARDYAARRREEAVHAVAALGLEEPRFAGLPDRGLAERRGALEAAIREELLDFRPDLVLCPSPSEIHPDHRALARVLFEAVSSSRAGDPDHELSGTSGSPSTSSRTRCFRTCSSTSPPSPTGRMPRSRPTGRSRRSATTPARSAA